MSARLSKPGPEPQPPTPPPQQPQSTPAPAQGNPVIPSGTQDHNFHTQAVFEINKQVAKLEASLGNVESRLSKLEVKIDQILIDFTSLKTSYEHTERLMGFMLKALWAIAGSIGVAGLGLLTFWLKKKFGL